jgi:hypothetical protein
MNKSKGETDEILDLQVMIVGGLVGRHEGSQGCEPIALVHKAKRKSLN